MHVLTDFIEKTMPDPCHLMYNEAVNSIIYFRMGDCYEALTQAVQVENNPYPYDFKDTVNTILMAGLSEIAHVHGFIIDTDNLGYVVKLISSLKLITEAPNPEIILDHITAFDDTPSYCMQQILQEHGGLDDVEWGEIVKMVSPLTLQRFQQHAEREQEHIDNEILNSIGEINVNDPEFEDKRRYLKSMTKMNPTPSIILDIVVQRHLRIGEPIDILIDELQEMIMALMPSAPAVAAANIIALTVIGDQSIKDLILNAKRNTERFYTNTGHISLVNEAIDNLAMNRE